MRDGVTSDEQAKIKDLMSEVKELNKSNDLLKLAIILRLIQANCLMLIGYKLRGI
jgi:hypothetical protein